MKLRLGRCCSPFVTTPAWSRAGFRARTAEDLVAIDWSVPASLNEWATTVRGRADHGQSGRSGGQWRTQTSDLTHAGRVL